MIILFTARRGFLLGGVANLREEVKFRLGQVGGHPVPLGRGQDAVSFSPDEGRGLGEAAEQGGDFGLRGRISSCRQTWRSARRRRRSR